MTETSAGDAAERYIPENLRSLRERKGISQTKLATAMQERGRAWHQTTVARVEAGLQEVKVGELIDLAWILGVTIDRFMWSGPESGEREAVASASARLHAAWREVALAVARLRDASEAARRTAERGAKSAFPRVRDAARGLAEDMADRALESALAEAGKIAEQDKGK
jgi:transcriptional regulator with XRE-family HTH domain